MADTQVKDMTEIVAPAATDVMYLQATPGGTPADRKVLWSTLPLPAGWLTGLKLTNDAGDTNHDIGIAVGCARSGDDTHNLKLSSALIKQIDASWAVGTNAGGMDTGASAANTWYYVWLIKRSDTGVVDVLFSTSNTSPTMPTNYDKKRRIGAVKTDGSSNIRQFFQEDDWFWWKDPTMDVNTTPGSTNRVTWGLGSSIPAGWRVEFHANTSNSASWYFSCPDFTDLAPSASATPGLSAYTSSVGQRLHGITDTSQQYSGRCNNSAGAIRIVPLCYKDLRGKDGGI